MIKMKKNGLVSIVLTLYNKAPYIEETIFSIYKQTYTNRELIIVDDCSTDGSFEIAKSFCEKIGITNKCKFIKNEKNLWVAKTFERGLREATGDWISMQDGDDILVKNKIETQILQCENVKADFCFCGYREIDENNKLNKENHYTKFTGLFFKKPCYKKYLIINDATGSGLFFNKKISNLLLEFGFPENVYQDFWVVVVNHLMGGKAIKMDEKLFYYRRCDSCISYRGEKKTIVDLYKSFIVMRSNAQEYALSFIKDESQKKRIHSLNGIDKSFVKYFNGEVKLNFVTKKIISSTLERKFKMVLLYQVLRIFLNK